jgi:hypothetical protein
LAAFDVGEDIIQHTDTTAGILCACRERHDVMNLPTRELVWMRQVFIAGPDDE